MRQLDHPNIVKLVSFSESSQYYYIVLELCPGGELFHQIVRLTYFSEDLSRHVIVQVAKALEYLHEDKGVVHRQVKLSHLVIMYPNLRPVISNRRTYFSILHPSFLPNTQSRDQPKTRTKLTKANSFLELAPAVLARSRLQTSDCPRLSGTVKR